jgi:nascent polypeptide-associated complex subunit alpha
MLGGVNPKQMEAMMKKMGINQEKIPAKRVIIETEDGDWIIENPDVMKIKMQGQESYQITGDSHFQEETNLFEESDVTMVMEKTEMDREIVIEHLEKNDGDIAATIMELKEKTE